MPIIVNGTTLNNVDVGGVNIQKVYARQGETGTYVLVFEKGGVVTMALWFGGNWKMNQTKAAIDTYFDTFNSALELNPTKKVVIFPPACYLDYTKSKISSALSSMVEIGIQNISAEAKGAYTGQISAQMAVDCGCKWAMLGHSEVREYLGVTDANIHDQLLQAVQNAKLKAVVCVGEPLEIRQAGTYEEYVENQLTAIFNTSPGLTEEELTTLVVVYEPIWAIGTGYTCSSNQANDMCSLIYNWFANTFNQYVADKMSICYGGASKPSNVEELISKPDIDGLLIAGASLQATNFTAMVNMA